MNYEVDANCELDLISQPLLIQLNDIIACIQGQVSTLANDIKQFKKLRDTLHDIRYVKADNKSSPNPSVKIKKELKEIQGYVKINIRLMRNQHRRRLAYFQSEQMEEGWADASPKMKHDVYISRTTQFIQQMELLLE